MRTMTVAWGSTSLMNFWHSIRNISNTDNIYIIIIKLRYINSVKCSELIIINY